MIPRVFEGEFRNARGSFFGDDFERFDDARHDFVLQPDILAFGVFPHDDQVHTGIAWYRDRADC